MLFLISLFLHCELISCVNYKKINFNEDSLMKQHNQNSFQIRAFIKEARHRFHDEPPALTDDQDTTRADQTVSFKHTNWWWDNSSFIEQLGLNTAKSFLFPQLRSRPSFPFSITPYTTELNYQHLNWDEIFPEPKLRSGSDAPTKLNESIPQVTDLAKDQNYSSTLDQSLSSRPFNATSDPKSFLRGPTTTLFTRNEDYMMWLQEVTTFTPVDRWLQTLTSRTGVTQSYTTNSTTPVNDTLFKAQPPAQNRQIKNDTTDQPPRILRQDLPLPHTPAHDEEPRVTDSTTSALFYLVNVSGIIHLRTATMKDQRRTDEIIVTTADDADVKKVLTTTREVIHDLGQDPKTPETSSRKSRRYQSKARKRKRYHRPHQRKKQRQKLRYRHLKYRDGSDYHTRDVEYPMLRRRRGPTGVQRRFGLTTPRLEGERKPKTRGFLSNAVTRPVESANHNDPTYLPIPTPTSKMFSKLYETEDERRLKLIESRYRLRYNRTFQKEKPIYHQVRERSKGVNVKGKDTRRNSKAELIRKIVEGSSDSYSDEEATLRKNFIGALRFGNRT